MVTAINMRNISLLTFLRSAPYCFSRVKARVLQAPQEVERGMETFARPAEQVMRRLGGYESARRKKKNRGEGDSQTACIKRSYT